jgi:hypothetical protein
VAELLLIFVGFGGHFRLAAHTELSFEFFDDMGGVASTAVALFEREPFGWLLSLLAHVVLDVDLGEDDGCALNASKRTSKTEVTELDSAVFVNEHISWFEIAMEHVGLMKILDCADQVVDDRLYVFDFQVDVGLDDLLEIGFGVFHYHVKGVEVLWVRRVKDFDELDDEGMAKLVHECDLAQDSFAVSFVLKNVLHSLDCDFAARRLLYSKSDLTVAACA